MSRSLINARGVLLGVFCTGALAFGAAQVFASPTRAAAFGSCQVTGFAYIPSDGCPECPFGAGYCDGLSTDCVCF